MVMVFDCESIPDVGLIKKVFAKEFEDRNITTQDDLEISKEAQKIQKELSGSEFLPICYHQVVSIAAVFCDEYGVFKKVGNFPSAGANKEELEKSLIKGFLEYLNKYQPKLVSFNGRGFDMPMLLLRAMKYKLSANAYFEVENPQFNKSKWENYRQRYSERFHTDLLDVLGNYGATRGLNLDTLANLIGLPGKFDVCGDMVLDLYYKKNMKKSMFIAKSDALNTYGLYLHYELLSGNLSLKEYQKLLMHWRNDLPGDKAYSAAFFATITQQIENL